MLIHSLISKLHSFIKLVLNWTANSVNATGSDVCHSNWQWMMQNTEEMIVHSSKEPDDQQFMCSTQPEPLKMKHWCWHQSLQHFAKQCWTIVFTIHWNMGRWRAASMADQTQFESITAFLLTWMSNCQHWKPCLPQVPSCSNVQIEPHWHCITKKWQNPPKHFGSERQHFRTTMLVNQMMFKTTLMHHWLTIQKSIFHHHSCTHAFTETALEKPNLRSFASGESKAPRKAFKQVKGIAVNWVHCLFHQHARQKWGNVANGTMWIVNDFEATRKTDLARTLSLQRSNTKREDW